MTFFSQYEWRCKTSFILTSFWSHQLHSVEFLSIIIGVGSSCLNTTYYSVTQNMVQNFVQWHCSNTLFSCTLSILTHLLCMVTRWPERILAQTIPKFSKFKHKKFDNIYTFKIFKLSDILMRQLSASYMWQWYSAVFNWLHLFQPSMLCCWRLGNRPVKSTDITIPKV